MFEPKPGRAAYKGPAVPSGHRLGHFLGKIPVLYSLVTVTVHTRYSSARDSSDPCLVLFGRNAKRMEGTALRIPRVGHCTIFACDREWRFERDSSLPGGHYEKRDIIWAGSRLSRTTITLRMIGDSRQA